MDRFSPPSLIPPMLASLLAACCFALARIERLPDGARWLLIAFGIILAVVASATGLDWLLRRGAAWLEDIRAAWDAPRLQMYRLVAGMNHEQLALAGMISPFRTEARMAGGQVQWWLHTPVIDIPYGWVSEYLELCELHYPELEPQHGKPDVLGRDYIRGFTGLMVANGLATQARGNQTARWNVPLAEVAKRLGLEES